ncbi:MAG TPA: FAD-dependent oxidoreductase, partial [Balneolaceae bacterium]|nr:FAD-dependent oxidoreductase [Balneolaceae bacterium]
RSEGLDFGFQRNGLFMLCKTEKGLKEETEAAEKARSLGIPAEILSAEETRQMEPDIQMDIIGAVYYPKDSHLHPGSLMNQLKTLLRKRGVQFVFNTKIVDITEEKDGEIVAFAEDQQKVEGTHIVLCTGAWTPSLANNLGLAIPMQAGKGYSITLQNPRELPQICALLAEAKVSMTPMMGKLRFGGTMEIVGRDKSVTLAKVSALKKSVVNYFPEYTMGDLEGQNVWVGLRPCSPDGLPYVGKTDKYDHVYISTGHAMMGMSLSFSSGELIEQLISNNQADLAHRLISPDRYS